MGHRETGETSRVEKREKKRGKVDTRRARKPGKTPKQTPLNILSFPSLLHT
jgi:hypothetical protein